METKKDFDKNAGEIIKSLREKKGLTLRQMATLLNTTYQQIQHYEHGRNGITAFKIFKIAKIFKKSPSFFFENFKKKAQ